VAQFGLAHQYGVLGAGGSNPLIPTILIMAVNNHYHPVNYLKTMSKIKFGTDGWRAVIAEDFTFDNLGLVVEAIALYLKQNNSWQKGIFIGYDNRFLSEDFAIHCAGVFSKNGIKAFIASESVPTPVTAFMTLYMELDGSIMITASHNPSKYNGIKFIPFYGGPAKDSITKKIEKNLRTVILDRQSRAKEESDLNSGGISLEEHESLKSGGALNAAKITQVSDFTDYIKKLLGLVDLDLIKKAGLNIAADTMFGAGSTLLPKILKDNLGIDAFFFNNYRDPLFGGRLPDPSNKNLTGLKEKVLKDGLDIGIALDGDADRFGVIDGKGIFISPNNSIAIILNYLIETNQFNKNDIVVRSVATTHLIDEICNGNGIAVVETPVGFKFIGEAMLGGNVIIGGEESGGLSLKGHIPEKDGLLACLKMLEIRAYLKTQRNSLHISDYLENIYHKYGHFYNLRLDIEVQQDKKQKIVKNFLNLEGQEISGIKVTGVSDLDGAKVVFENKSWILVRASGTEPLVRCYTESPDSGFFDSLKKYTSEVIRSI
jgi:alpha-D-glucose phosphate-specific phosphoglucomutase